MADSRQVDRDIGALISAARRHANLTQDQLGKKLGIVGDHVSRYERGTVRVNASRLQAIADVCGVRRDFFTQSFERAPQGEDGLARLEQRVRELEDRLDEEGQQRPA